MPLLNTVVASTKVTKPYREKTIYTLGACTSTSFGMGQTADLQQVEISSSSVFHYTQLHIELYPDFHLIQVMKSRL